MAAKTGKGVVQIADVIEALFREWQQKAGSLEALFSQGQPISIDLLANQGYHDARRALESFDAMEARIISKGWVSAVRAEGVNRHGAGYDLVAESQAFRTLLAELQAAIITAVGGVDANGFIQGPYIKLSNNGPFFNTVDPVDYAPVNTKLQEMLASIEG